MSTGYMSARPRFPRVSQRINAWNNIEASQTRPLRCFKWSQRTINTKNCEEKGRSLIRRELCAAEIVEKQNGICEAKTPFMEAVKISRKVSLAATVEMVGSNINTPNNTDESTKEEKFDKLLFASHAKLSKSETEIESEILSKYPKFIPVEDMEVKLYPKSKLDMKYPRCWLDIQTWFQQCHRCNSHKIDTILYQTMNSKSESAINCLEKNVDKLSVYPDGGDPLSLPGQEVENHPRFGFKNSTYCIMASKIDWSQGNRPPLELYIEILANGRPNPKLSQMKTEMIVKCLQSFFFPCGDAMVHCVESIAPHVQMVTGTATATDLFGRKVSWVNSKNPVKAILFLSGVPATLLKHDNLCVLDTLSFSIGIPRESLLVLPMVKLQTVEIVNENQ